MSKIVLFQAIQFSISMQFSSIWLKDRTLSGATIPGQGESGNNGNEQVPCIPQSSSITESSPSDCLVSYLEHLLGDSYLSAEMRLVYSTAPAEWAKKYYAKNIFTIQNQCLFFIIRLHACYEYMYV